MIRIQGNGQPGELEKIRQWTNAELRELHTRISGVRDAMSVKQWLPLLINLVLAVIAIAALIKK